MKKKFEILLFLAYFLKPVENIGFCRNTKVTKYRKPLTVSFNFRDKYDIKYISIFT